MRARIGWLAFSLVLGTQLAGCTYTGSRSYSHGGGDYVVEDGYQHVDEDDYYFGDASAPHRSHVHPARLEKEGYYHGPYNPDPRYELVP